MRVPERAHKRPQSDQRYCVATVTVPDSRPAPTSRNCGTSWMMTMSTQRPIAVSMVAGRVRSTGVGLCVRRSSGMADTPNCFIKMTAERPAILGQAAETIEYDRRLLKGKMYQSQQVRS